MVGLGFTLSLLPHREALVPPLHCPVGLCRPQSTENDLACEVTCLNSFYILGVTLGAASPIRGVSDRLFFTVPANKGCGVWMMSSSLPHVSSNHVSYNGLYGVAVFSQKDGEFPGGHGAQENFSEDGDAILWETELEKEDDPLRRPVTVALVESNSINHNGGECAHSHWHPSWLPPPRGSLSQPVPATFHVLSLLTN